MIYEIIHKIKENFRNRRKAIYILKKRPQLTNCILLKVRYICQSIQPNYHLFYDGVSKASMSFKVWIKCSMAMPSAYLKIFVELLFQKMSIEKKDVLKDQHPERLHNYEGWWRISWRSVILTRNQDLIVEIWLRMQTLIARKHLLNGG